MLRQIFISRNSDRHNGQVRDFLENLTVHSPQKVCLHGRAMFGIVS